MLSTINKTKNGFSVSANLWERWADQRERMELENTDDLVWVLHDEFWYGRWESLHVVGEAIVVHFNSETEAGVYEGWLKAFDKRVMAGKFVAPLC
jgi:hypothetical protein